MNRRILILLTILLPVALSSWLLREAERPAPTQAEPGSVAPDYYLRGMLSMQTDPQGRLQHQLHATSLTHYPHNGEILLEQPRLHLHQQDGSLWLVVAQHGRLSDGQEELQLRGEVRIEQQDSPQGLRLETDYLLIWPEQEYASTSAPVRIFRPGSTLEGIGMELYGEQQRLILLSKVRGRHENYTP